MSKKTFAKNAVIQKNAASVKVAPTDLLAAPPAESLQISQQLGQLPSAKLARGKVPGSMDLFDDWLATETQPAGVDALATGQHIVLAQAPAAVVTDVPAAAGGVGEAAAGGSAASAGAATASAASVGTATAATAALGGISTGTMLAAAVGVGAAAGVAGMSGGGGNSSKSTVADTTAPNAPVINLVSTDDRINGTEKAAGVAVSGTAEAGAIVHVVWGSGGVAKDVTADASGNWSANFAAGEIPADGSMTITATAKDAAGNTSAATSHAVTVDTVAPIIQLLEAHSGSQTIVLTYNEALGGAPNANAFVVTTGGSANPVDAINVAGTTITLTLHNPFNAGAVTVSYTDPTAGNDLAAIQDAAGNDALGFSSGIVADGYVRGATVQVLGGENGTTVLWSGTTDAHGNFFIPAGIVGTIVATGGVNIDTGVPNTMTLKAPSGSTTINPLTTLVQAVVEQSGSTATAAAETVASNLGLSLNGASLLSFDPISAASSSDSSLATAAIAAQKVAAQVATVVTLVASSATDANSAVAATNAVLGSLATQISQAQTDISNTVTLSNALSSANVATEAASAIADATATIAKAISISEITQAQSQYLDKIAPDAPVLSVDTPTNSTSPSIRVSLSTTDTGGKAVVVNDLVTIFDNGIPLGNAIKISATNIADGYVDIPLSLSEGTHALTGQLTDQAGNVSSVSDPKNLVVDVTPPITPVIDVVAGDNTINLSEKTAGVTLTGVAEAGAAVQLTLGANRVVQATVGAGGGWSYKLTAADFSALGQGSVSIKAVATDNAGNQSTVPASVGVMIDTVAPTATATIVSAADNVAPATGNVVSGGSTNDQTLGLAGTLSATLGSGESLYVYDGSTQLGVAVVDGKNWSFTTPALSNANHALTARVVDAAGNAGALSNAYGVTVNADIPTGTASFNSNAGVTTNAGELSAPLEGTYTGLASGDKVVLFDGATRLGEATLQAELKTWSFKLLPSMMADGVHQLRVAVEGSGGNLGVLSSALSLTLDTLAPTNPTIDVIAGDDRISAAELKAGVTITGTTDTSAKGISLWFGDSTTASVSLDVGGTGKWAYTLTENDIVALGQGSKTVHVSSSDSANNVSQVTSRSFVMATEAPLSPVIVSVAGDGALNASEVGKTLVVGTAASGNAVLLAIGGASRTITADGDGNWSYQLTASDVKALGQGGRSISAKQIDADGNVSALTSASVLVDTLAPVLSPIMLKTESDTGVKGDGRSNIATPSFNFSAEQGTTVSVLSTDGLTFKLSKTGSDTATKLDTYSLDIISGLNSDKAYSFKVSALDLAGNETVRSAAYTLDMTKPAAPDSKLAKDSGVSSTDGITNSAVVSAASNLESNAKLEYRVDGGEWLSNYVPPTSEQLHTVEVRQIDVAGNISDVDLISFRLDKTVATTNLSLIDSGTLDTDSVTNNAAIASVGDYEKGATFEYKLDNGAWSSSYSAPTADGTHTLLIHQTDLAGNVSASQQLNFKLDTVAPTLSFTAPAAKAYGAGQSLIFTAAFSEAVAASSQSAPLLTIKIGAGDDIVLNAVPVMNSQGLVTSLTYTYLLQPTDKGDVSIVGYPLPTTNLPTDIAGNTLSTANFALPTTAGISVVEMVVPTVALVNDNGVSKTDGITNDASLALSSLAAGLTRKFVVDSGVAAATYTAPTVNGVHTVQVIDTNAQGVSVSSSLTFTLDKTVPATPNAKLGVDSGTSQTDGITNTAGITPPASKEEGASVEYKLDSGAWTTTYVPTTAEGAHTVLVRQTDVAGNVSATQTLNFTLDTTNPATPNAKLTTDSGVSTSDGKTSNAAITAPTNVESNAKTEYKVDAGEWSTTYTAPSVDGAHVVQVRQTDLAGNVSDIQTINFTLDKLAPTLSLTAPTAKSYGAGQSLVFTASFSEAVVATVQSTPPVLTIKIGNGSNVALTANPVTNTDGLLTGFTYTYQLQASDKGDVSIVSYPAPTANVPTDVAGNALSLTGFTLPAMSGVTVVELAAPTVALSNDTGTSSTDKLTNDPALSISSLASGMTRQFKVDNGALSSSYTPPSSTGSHTVQVIDTNAQNVSVSSSITFTLDHSVPTVASQMTLPSATSFSVGQTMDFVVNFTEAVAVLSGSTPVPPSLVIKVGGGNNITVTPTVISGNSGTLAGLKYSYTVQAGDSGEVSVVGLSGGSLTGLVDLAGNAFALPSQSLTANTGISVTATAVPQLDTSKPHVVFISSETSYTGVATALDTANPDSLDFSVQFSEPVVISTDVSKQPTLKLLIGSQTYDAKVDLTGVTFTTGVTTVNLNNIHFIYTLTGSEKGAVSLVGLNLASGATLQSAVSGADVSLGIGDFGNMAGGYVYKSLETNLSSLSLGDNHLIGVGSVSDLTNSNLLAAVANGNRDAVALGVSATNSTTAYLTASKHVDGSNNYDGLTIVLHDGTGSQNVGTLLKGSAGYTLTMGSTSQLVDASVENLVLFVKNSAGLPNNTEPLFLSLKQLEFAEIMRPNDVAIMGTVMNDSIDVSARATAQNIYIETGPGGDTVTGHAGVDVVDAGGGNNTVNTSDGNDNVLLGGSFSGGTTAVDTGADFDTLKLHFGSDWSKVTSSVDANGVLHFMVPNSTSGIHDAWQVSKAAVADTYVIKQIGADGTTVQNTYTVSGAERLDGFASNIPYFLKQVVQYNALQGTQWSDTISNTLGQTNVLAWAGDDTLILDSLPTSGTFNFDGGDGSDTLVLAAARTGLTYSLGEGALKIMSGSEVLYSILPYVSSAGTPPSYGIYNGIPSATNTPVMNLTAEKLKVGNLAEFDLGSLNFTQDSTAPTLQSASVTGNTLSLSFNETLDNANPPGVGAFSVTAGGSSVGVSSVSISGTTATLTLMNAVASGQAVTVSYGDTTSANDVYALQDLSGNDVASISSVSVTNNTGASAPLVKITSGQVGSGTVQTFGGDSESGWTLSGAEGQTLTFTITRSGTSAELNSASVVDWSIAGWGTGNTAADAIDFVGGASSMTGQVSFASGETAKTVTVSLAVDTTAEVAEKFSITINPDKSSNISVVADSNTTDGKPPFSQQAYGEIAASSAEADTTAPFPVAASFSGSTYSVTFSETIQIASSGNAPVMLKNGVGTAIGFAGQPTVSADGKTVSVTLADDTLTATDYIQVTCSNYSIFRDLAGNPVVPGVRIVGGEGNNVIDYADSWMPVTILANGGADTLSGSGMGDLLVLSETSAAKDTVKVALYDASTPFFMDTLVGFDSSSVTLANHDVLNLPSQAIAANTAASITLSAASFSFSITNGIASLTDNSSTPVLVSKANLNGVLSTFHGYLKAGETVALKADMDGNGQADGLLVYQSNGSSGTWVNDDILVYLQGSTATKLGTTAADATVLLADTTGPDITMAVADTAGLHFYASEAVDLGTGKTDLSGLDFYLNGATKLAPTGLTNTGHTAQLDVSFGSGTLTDGSYVLVKSMDTTKEYLVDTLGNKGLSLFDLGGGSDGVAIAVGTAGSTINLAAAQVSGIYGLMGAAGSDVLKGTAQNNSFEGMAGNDQLFGYGGNDDLYGGEGNDLLSGGTGDDHLEGEHGVDVLNGGAGADTFVFEQGDSNVGTLSSGSFGDGATFSFTGGTDRIEDLSAGDVIRFDSTAQWINPPQAMGAFATNGSFVASMPSDGKVTDQHYFYVQGNYNVSSGVFTVAQSSGLDTLVVYDGDGTSAVSQTGVVLQGVKAAQLQNWGGNELSVIDTAAPVLLGSSIGTYNNAPTLTLKFSENVVMSGSSLSIKVGTNSVTLSNPVYGDKTLTLTSSTPLVVESAVSSGNLMLDFQYSNAIKDTSGNALTLATVVIGSDSNNASDQSNNTSFSWPMTMLGNGGNDTLTGTENSGDVLSGGGDVDTINGSWGSDKIYLNEQSPASDTVVIGADGESNPWWTDAVFNFDVSGTASTNDILDLPSAQIASAVQHVDGVDVATAALPTFARHSIGSGGILTFEMADNTAIQISKSSMQVALQYLHTNLMTGTTVAFEVDTDNNGYADSLYVYQRGGDASGSNYENDVLVRLAGLTATGTNAVSLSNGGGQGLVTLVDSIAPSINDHVLTANGLTLYANEALSSANLTGLTLLKNGTTGMGDQTTTVSGNAITVVTNGTLADTDYLLIKVAPDHQNQSFSDVNGAHTSNLFYSDEAGVALGGTGNNTIDLSGLVGAYSIHDKGGINTLIGNDSDNGISSGTGNDTLSGKEGNDRLEAGGGNDTLDGGNGNDQLVGGTGGDTLTGGSGSDVFAFHQGDSNQVSYDATSTKYALGSIFDRITDFSAGDRIAFWSQNQNQTTLSHGDDTGTTVGDQQYICKRGDLNGTDFTLNASSGKDTLVIYDGNGASSTVTQTAFVLSGVAYDATNWNLWQGGMELKV